MTFQELLERQISRGADLMERIVSLKELPEPEDDFGDGMAVFSMQVRKSSYNVNEIDSLSSELQRWQNVSMDVLRQHLSKECSYITNFSASISDKRNYFNPQRGLKNELQKGIDILESVKESLLFNLLPEKGEKQENTVTGIGSKKTVNVFISHSSVDKAIIKQFVEKVLCLGLGLDHKDIAFTSEECFGVEPGEDIAKYIKENIIGASVVLVMISNNYKSSEVCLNEMGAAWALKKKCISVVLPDAGFGQLGWLTSFEKAVSLKDKNQIINLCQTIANNLGIDLNQRFTVATSNIGEFVDNLDKIKQPATKLQAQKTIPICDDSLVALSTSFRVFEEDEGLYPFQIDVKFTAQKKDVYLKTVKLLNNKRTVDLDGFGAEDDILNLRKYLKLNTLDIEIIKKKDYRNIVDEHYKTSSIYVEDHKLDNSALETMSFHGTIGLKRQMDGYDELDIAGWELYVTYNVIGELTIPLQIKMIK